MYRACTAPLGVQTLYMDSTTHSSWDMQQVWGGMHSARCSHHPKASHGRVGQGACLSPSPMCTRSPEALGLHVPAQPWLGLPLPGRLAGLKVKAAE